MDNDGGPAFPCDMTFSEGRLQGVQTGPHSGIAPGFSIRDYFAAAALQGLAAVESMSEADVVCCCYRFADAMLAAREKA